MNIFIWYEKSKKMMS